MEEKMDCLFCKIIQGEIPAKIIYEDEFTIAFLDLYPNSEGHTLVIPKKHCVDFTDSDLTTAQQVVAAKKAVVEILRQKLNPVGFNFVSNQGSEAHQVIFHYHEHIIPKYVKELGYSPAVSPDPKARDTETIFQIIKK
jgi:histidine triad (HIT) family protein